MSKYRQNEPAQSIDEIPNSKRVSISINKNNNRDFVFNKVDPDRRQKVNLFEASPTKSVWEKEEEARAQFPSLFAQDHLKELNAYRRIEQQLDGKYAIDAGWEWAGGLEVRSPGYRSPVIEDYANQID